ncbi:bifunctional glutamate N-acetyltransferase/amino-acid acetyltransferase ArgJ [Isosphaeraceae bacterium EP7]
MAGANGQASLKIPKGYRAGAVRAGIKPSGGLDLTVLASETDCSAAGTFTLNRVAAAPVKWGRDHVPSGAIRAIVINAGNANAATGAQGEADVSATAEHVARGLGCRADQVLVASTGVIGHHLPMAKVEAGVAGAIAELSAGEENFRLASQAIMTTDTRTKVVARTIELAGREIRILGLAKGAAMIGPRMATMLGFLLTDANVSPTDLQAALGEAVETSFNCISVEGHTSTNDTVFLLANGAAGGDPLEGDDLGRFADVIKDACGELARMIPEDGEGATHLITIDVVGTIDREEARTIARAVADSPLVKTAIHGADPNWGRIVSAAGYSGVEFDESELSLHLNGVLLYEDGAPRPFDAVAVSDSIRSNRETAIKLTLTRGDGAIRFWTCDLTAEYIRLNADYTT